MEYLALTSTLSGHFRRNGIEQTDGRAKTADDERKGQSATLQTKMVPTAGN